MRPNGRMSLPVQQCNQRPIRSGAVALLRCKAMQVFWGQIPISMRSTRQGRPKGGGFWNLTPINRGRRRLPYLRVSLNPRLLGSESKKTCPSGIPAGAARPYWNLTPISASHPLCTASSTPSPIRLNQAVFAFRRYEDASLRYTGLASHDGLTHYGLYDTVVARDGAA